MSNRFCIKFVAQPNTNLDEEALIPVFHEWIRERKLPGVMFDVVDYRHVPEGPGIMLITHEINYAMEHGNGEYGLSAQLKIAESENPAESLVDLVGRAAQFGALLEADDRLAGQVKLNGNQFYYIANDRLNAPNTDAAFTALKGNLEAAAAKIYPSQSVTIARVENDPRERLTVLVSVPDAIEMSAIAA